MKIIKSRLFKALVILLIVGFILGIISYFILDNSNDSIINYFSLLKESKLNYSNSLLISLIQNYKYSIIIWILGIIFMFSFIIPFIILYRGISLGLTLFSIIVIFKTKGLLISFILLFPTVLLNELIFLLLSYYAINFSLKVYRSIKNNKMINIKSFSRNYFYIFLISLGLLLLSSIFEIYITSNIIKYVL
ncbi:MAG: stage II sporulation protein M [Bacilli bacterium]|nr:stage II sporulation protein M [Bacilli bacterium]